MLHNLIRYTPTQYEDEESEWYMIREGLKDKSKKNLGSIHADWLNPKKAEENITNSKKKKNIKKNKNKTNDEDEGKSEKGTSSKKAKSNRLPDDGNNKDDEAQNEAQKESDGGMINKEVETVAKSTEKVEQKEQSEDKDNDEEETELEVSSAAGSDDDESNENLESKSSETILETNDKETPGRKKKILKKPYLSMINKLRQKPFLKP